MHKFMVGLLIGMFSLAAYGQEIEMNAPKAEFFGGYQYTRFDGGTNANGWNMAANSNFNKWFGIGGDFSGAYAKPSGVSLNTYTYTFGPVVAYRHNEKVTPFAHFLLGGYHASASAGGVSASNSGFAMMFGGGFDVKATRHVALRAVQFDWLSLHSNGTSDNNNMRLSTGLLFRY
jgi:hypothetical protein